MQYVTGFAKKLLLMVHLKIPYTGKFSKGLPFENFKSSQAFWKICTFLKSIKLSRTYVNVTSHFCELTWHIHFITELAIAHCL